MYNYVVFSFVHLKSFSYTISFFMYPFPYLSFCPCVWLCLSLFLRLIASLYLFFKPHLFCFRLLYVVVPIFLFFALVGVYWKLKKVCILYVYLYMYVLFSSVHFNSFPLYRFHSLSFPFRISLPAPVFHYASPSFSALLPSSISFTSPPLFSLHLIFPFPYLFLYMPLY